MLCVETKIFPSKVIENKKIKKIEKNIAKIPAKTTQYDERHRYQVLTSTKSSRKCVGFQRIRRELIYPAKDLYFSGFIYIYCMICIKKSFPPQSDSLYK